MVRETADGVEIAVRVIPRARKSEIAGSRGDALLVRLAAPPVAGAANAALVSYLAERLNLPARAIQIVAGDKSRDKRVRISGMRAEAALRMLNSPPSG
jgi:uncharacterized protein